MKKDGVGIINKDPGKLDEYSTIFIRNPISISNIFNGHKKSRGKNIKEIIAVGIMKKVINGITKKLAKKLFRAN